MVEFWVTRSPRHPKYPGGAWHFWADGMDSPPMARRVIGPKPDGGNEKGEYTPSGTTFLEAKVALETDVNSIWEIISEEEAVRIVLGGMV